MSDQNEPIVTKVPRALEMKSKLFGYELPDLLVIFANLAITNLIFGSTSFRYPLVWGTTLGLAAFLFFAKKGKPDGYLQHLGEFWASPTTRFAGLRDIKYKRFHRKDFVNEKS